LGANKVLYVYDGDHQAVLLSAFWRRTHPGSERRADRLYQPLMETSIPKSHPMQVNTCGCDGSASHLFIWSLYTTDKTVGWCASGLQSLGAGGDNFLLDLTHLKGRSTVKIPARISAHTIEKRAPEWLGGKLNF
jgi:hypothetical protein